MSSLSNLQENVRVALRALIANKLRAILTTLGIGIGIAAVIILISSAAPLRITSTAASPGLAPT
jgi:putative ABC transport system permease protein